MPGAYNGMALLSLFTSDLAPGTHWMFSLIGWYALILTTHQLAVTLSVSLFIARGVGVSVRQHWPMFKFWRMVSVWIDVILLSSGIALWHVGSYNPLQQHWLGIKMLLLALYIVLGSFALKRGKTPKIRLWFFVASLLCVFTMISIALTRQPQPFGWISNL